MSKCPSCNTELSQQDIDSGICASCGTTISNESETQAVQRRLDPSLSETAMDSLVVETRQFSQAEDVRAGAVDYQVVDLLGEGGIGTVSLARQNSVARQVAVKMLHPEYAMDKDQRDSFLSEAVVTGDLEHPNIVPIYDLGKTNRDELFYSMKRVQGTPWMDVIRSKTISENLEILMKVADAVAFAHSRGVIHRDLKPENVMLGDFGEVLVMDWGLALLLPDFGKADFVKPTTQLGFTPTYAAPELIIGPVEEIDASCDVYLLGAILYEILTGLPPHEGSNMSECLISGVNNEIRPTSKKGELVDIAMKAMATDASRRFASVQEFESAIRQYQSHSDSLAMSSRAQTDFDKGTETGDYEVFSRSVFGFQEALNLWTGNETAKSGLLAAKCAYAKRALDLGDFDLGASLLDSKTPEHAELLIKIDEARRVRSAREQKLKAARRIAQIGVVTFLVVVTGAALWINAERNKAVEQEQLAKKNETRANKSAIEAEQNLELAKENEREANRQTELAQKNADKAEKAAGEATKQRRKAEQNASDALKQKGIAEEQKGRAEYQVYIAQIGLAAEKIADNAYDDAERILEAIRSSTHRNWEWNRLWYLCQQGEAEIVAPVKIDSVAFDRQGKRFITGRQDGKALVWDLHDLKKPIREFKHGNYVHSVAISHDGKVATCGDEPIVRIWNINDGSLIAELKGPKGHTDSVTDVAFSNDGQRVVTSSYDMTARLWDVQTGKHLQTLFGHTWWVWAAAFSPDGRRVVTVGQDERAIVWEVDKDETYSTYKRKTEFIGHAGPVYAVAFSPDGKRVVTGGNDHLLLIWDPDRVAPPDIGRIIAQESVQKSEATPLKGHKAGVRSVSFSFDGRLILSGSDDNTVKVWDATTGALQKTLRGHGSWVRTCAFSPTNSVTVLSGSYDRKVKLWRIDRYEEIRVLQDRVISGHTNAILSARFDAKGERVVTSSRDHTAKIWKTNSAQLEASFEEGHEFLASSATFFPGQRKVLTSSVDGTTRIWDVTKGAEIASLNETGPNAVASLSSDGRWILTGSDDNSAKLWEVAPLLVSPNVSKPRVLAGHKAKVTAAAFSSDNRWLFTGDEFGVGLLWDSELGKVVHRFTGHSDRIVAAFFRSNDRRVLVASADNTVSQWSREDGQELKQLVLPHPGSVTSISLSRDGTRAVAVCGIQKGAKAKKYQMMVWEIDTAKLLRTISLDDEIISSVALSPDGNRALTVGTGTSISDLAVRLWDVENGAELKTTGKRKPFLDAQRLKGLAWSAYFSPDTRFVLTVGGNSARVFDQQSGKLLMTLSPHNAVTSSGFSSDGKFLATGSWDHSAKIWDARSGKAVLKLPIRHTGAVNCVVFSRVAGSYKLLTTGDDRKAFLWEFDPESKEVRLILEYDGHTSRIQCGAFSRDDKKVATASDDRTIRVWNANTGDQLRVLDGHESAVNCVAFSDDGKWLVSCDDTTARIWDVISGKPRLAEPLQGHTAGITSVAFSRDGTRILTGSRDNTVKLWDSETGAEVLTLRGHTNGVTSVCFSPDGNSVLTSSLDGTAILWLSQNSNGSEPEK